MSPLAAALRCAPRHNGLCGNVSPLTAIVKEKSLSKVVVAVLEVVVTAVLGTTVSIVVLIESEVTKLGEPDVHEPNTKIATQNLIDRGKNLLVSKRSLRFVIYACGPRKSLPGNSPVNSSWSTVCTPFTSVAT